MFLSRQLEPSCVSASLPLCFSVSRHTCFSLVLIAFVEQRRVTLCSSSLSSPSPQWLKNICSVFYLLGCRWGKKKHKLGSYFLSILMRKQCVMGNCTIMRPFHSNSYTLLHTYINKMKGITSKTKVEHAHSILLQPWGSYYNDGLALGAWGRKLGNDNSSLEIKTPTLSSHCNLGIWW